MDSIENHMVIDSLWPDTEGLEECDFLDDENEEEE